MRVLIACEFSGTVSTAFRLFGHDAWSCDLLPADGDPRYHIQADLRSVIQDSWDFIGFHTDCTYMTVSGVRWLHTDPSRWAKLDEATSLFNLCLRDPRPGYLENPIPHGYAVQRIDRNYDQLIQPWHFGHEEMKATCLWLKQIPELRKTEVVGPPPKDPVLRRAWAKVHRMPPGPNRWKERSRTFPGIAIAMAHQWGAP